ncbi:MAG: cytochrome d ubiquinol oxidase subunit II [Elusimicrobia bacterium]|nr:cytochrome d ubiquinol oxidase subunit II [Candidatus Obscuribacterium magneticum]
MFLQVIWYWLIVFLFAAYAVLDGFDFGVGFLQLFSKSVRERDIHAASIAPVWDGNEVWLLTAGGALFAAFPAVYAAILSGFYPAIMIFLAALVFRASAIEFRGQVRKAVWKRSWDFAFGLGSAIAPFLLGVIAGNLLRGMLLDQAGNYSGTFIELLNPFSLMMGLLNLVVFSMHGALYLSVKTVGETLEKAIRNSNRLSTVVIVFWFLMVFIATNIYPHLMENFRIYPIAFLFPVLVSAAFLNVVLMLRREAFQAAFISSSIAIILTAFMIGFALFPHLVGYLDIYNSSSSEKALQTMLVVAVLGMPLVLFYTAYVFRVFRGKVKAGDYSHY